MTPKTHRTAQRQRKKEGAAQPVGAPTTLIDAKRVTVILDAPTRAIASVAGAGNVSSGLRILAEYFSENHK